MTLTRHTQVENLVNLLRLHRNRAGQVSQRDLAYRQLVATILEVPADRVATVPAASSLSASPAVQFTARRVRAA